MKFELKLGKLNISLGNQSSSVQKQKTINAPINQAKKDYTYAPLKTSLLPTPAEMKNAIVMVEQDPRPMMDILRKLPQASMHLLGALGKRQDALLAYDYRVIPQKALSENEAELKKCDEITNRLYSTNFHSAIRNIINGVLYGHSVTQPMWYLNDMNQYYPHFEKYDFINFAKKDGELKLIADKSDKDFLKTIGDNANITGVNNKTDIARAISNSSNLIYMDIKQDNLIVAQSNPFEGLQKDYLGGLVRPALYLTLLLHFNLIDWARFNELFGLPFRIGKYDTFASDKAVQVLTDAVKNLGTDASAVVDKSTEIEFKESQQSNRYDTFKEFAKYVETKQSILVQGETLTTDVGSTGGNRALGEVHKMVSDDKLYSDILLSIPLITEKVVKMDYFLNYGTPPNGMYPKFKFDLGDAKDYQLMATIVERLGRAGLEMSESRLYEEFKEMGIEKPRDKDDVLKSSKSPFELS